MHGEIKYSGKQISYQEQGEGFPIVLLHGYLESLAIWEKFAQKLSTDNRVIAIDLPGHGNSDTISSVHSMKTMAESVNAVLEFLNVQNCFMIGHSMGGYVTMEFLNNFPEKLKGICLFHSTPYADSEEKKNIRNRLVEAIEAGKHIALAKEHVEKTFAKDNIEKFVQEIGFIKIIAINTKPIGNIAALKGMRERQDLSTLLKLTPTPSLWIFGAKDNFISTEIIKNAKLKNTEIQILENSGHQGFIEEEEKSLKIIRRFLDKIKS